MKNIILGSIFILLVSVSCREKIEMDLKSTYVRLVIDGSVTDEAKRHTVLITESSNYFSNDAQPRVSGAIVTIDDGSGEVVLSETSAGVYQTDSDYTGVIGRTYVLNVKYKGEEYSSSCMLKPVATLDSISFGKDQFEPTKNTVNMWAQEPASVGDYYLWLYYVNGKLESDTIKEVFFASDELVNGNYMPGFAMYSGDFSLGDTVTLEMKSINKGYYDFLNSLFSEVFGAGNPFSGPPANVKGNIVNLTHKDEDVMGYFIASAVSKRTQIVQQIDQ